MKLRNLFLTMVLLAAPVIAAADDAIISVAGQTVNLTTSGNVYAYNDCVYYNASTKTLRIRDAKITPDKYHGIYIGIDGVTIEFVGSSTVYSSAKGKNAICVSAKAKTVKIIGADSYAKVTLNTPVNGNSAALQISSACKVSFEAVDADIDGYYGIRGSNGTIGEEIYIGKDAHVRARGTSGSVTNLSYINYYSDYGLFFNSRDSNVTGGYFDTTKHAICATNGTTVANNYVHFGKYYQLDIDQDPVHSGNYRDLAAALSCVTGKLSYDPANQQLTTERGGATVTPVNTSYNGNVIFSRHPLSINIEVGFLTINAENVTSGYALNVQGALTITGTGREQCFLQTEAGIFANGRITVDKTRLQLKAQQSHAIRAASFYATETSMEATSDNADGTISTDYISTPSAYWLYGNEDYCLIPYGGKLLRTPEEGNVSGRVKLIHGSRNFSLQVGAMTLSTDNFYPVKSDYISGEVYYVPADHRLILKNAKVKVMPGDGHGIVNHATNKPLNVMVSGKNQVVTELSCLEPGAGDGELYGDGDDAELLLQSEKGCGIKLAEYSNQDYTIRGLKLNVKAGQYGIKGISNDRLFFRDVTAELQADEGAIAGLGTVYYYDCFIASPANVSYDENTYKLGGNVVKNMLIARNADKLPLTVCGQSVAKFIGYDILGDGSVTYEELSGVPMLVFHKNISYNGSYLIENTGVNPLLIKTDAPCALSAKTNIIRTDKNIILAAENTLKLSVSSSSSTAIYMRNGSSIWMTCNNLIIDNCKWGIAGMQKNTNENFYFNGKATINSTAGAIMDFKTLQLLDGEILEPEGGYIGDYNVGKAILGTDGEPAKYVKIGSTDEDEPADLNHDGVVNVGDVTTLVNMILGKTPIDPAADLNNDGSVNVGDVTTLVNIILGK